MKVTPSARITRFAQLSIGDLFLYEHTLGTCVGMAVSESNIGEKLVLPLGPNLPDGMRWPTLQVASGLSVISFGQDFLLRLPVHSAGWTTNEPSAESRAIFVATDRVYFRASFSQNANDFRPCFVEIATGLIHLIGGGATMEYTRPSGTSAFAIKWEIVTTEHEPRVILGGANHSARNL